MRKSMALVLAGLITFTSVISVNASGFMTSEKEISETVIAKRELVEQHSDEYIPNFRNTEEGDERQNRVVDLLCKMQTGEIDSQTAIDALEDEGIYKLEDNIQGDNVVVASEPGNIKLNDVTVNYDSYNNTWIVTGGGYWRSVSYIRAEMDFYPGFGKCNIGGYDAVGISLYNTSGTYNTRVVESYGYCSSDVESKYNYNPTICDGRQGAVFEYQDMVNTIDGEFVYLGKRFAAVMVFDANFANFNGYARAYYLHTWKNAVIDSIGFGTDGKTWTFNVSITNKANSFACYSSGETRF